MQKGLEATASLWPEIETASAWVQHAAALLENAPTGEVLVQRHQYRQLLAHLAPLRQSESAFLSLAATQFIKVTKSYWRGLFCCYEQADLPRTNNAAEQGFGSFRYHERRATGRKATSATTVLRGCVRILAATAQPPRPFGGSDLRPRSYAEWQQLRAELDQKQETRRQQRRFRRDPEAYLVALEEQLLKATLPT